jgi:hypothetical protein
MPYSKERPRARATTGNLWIPSYKVPGDSTLKLICTAIGPYPVVFGYETPLKNAFPMQHEAMLHKIAIVFHIVTNVEMVARDITCALIMWIWVRVSDICYVYKDTNLVAMPVHGLDFILDLKRIIFSIVNDGHHCVCGRGPQARPKLLILPLRHKTMTHKKLEFRLEVFD